MKFYNSIGPNPRMVRFFMAEKGLDIPRVEVDLLKAENRGADYTAKNPQGQTPSLELNDGRHLAEITAICEYLEELHPMPALIGSTPVERAETRMWSRRIDHGIVEPMANGFRFAEGLAMFKSRMQCEPEAAPGLKRIAQAKLAWLDKQMDGKTWICGNRFSMADILLFAFQDFGNTIGQPLNPEFKNLTGWFARVKDRPAAKA
jgi:glutathione S-transferase